MKKLIAIVISVLMLVSLAPAAFAETPALVSAIDISEAVELEASDFTTDSEWILGETGDLFHKSNKGDANNWFTYTGDKTEYNSARVTLTITPFEDCYEGNIIFAYFIGENGNGYCFEYYPNKGKFYISYNDDMKLAMSEPEYFLPADGTITATAVFENGKAAIVYNGAIVCYCELLGEDVGQNYPTLKGWAWQIDVAVMKYELLNSAPGIPDIVEETEEETEAQTDAQEQTEAQTDAQTDAQTEAETKAAEKSGCKSSVAVASVAMVAALGCCLLKKKEN